MFLCWKDLDSIPLNLLLICASLKKIFSFCVMLCVTDDCLAADCYLSCMRAAAVLWCPDYVWCTSLCSLPSLPPRVCPQRSWEQVGCDCGPGKSAAHSCSVRPAKGPGAELETAGAPQPQNCFLWHHLGVTARGELLDLCVCVKMCGYVYTLSKTQRIISQWLTWCWFDGYRNLYARGGGKINQ